MKLLIDCKIHSTKAIMKCQLDIFEQIGLILAELQEQARQDAEDDGNNY